MNVAKPFVRAHPFLNTCGFIPERNHINVRNVVKPSVRAYTLLVISEVILEINLVSVMNVGKPLIKMHALSNIRLFVQERSPPLVINVVKPLLRTLPLLNMKETFISVKNLSASKHTLVNITEFILEKGLMNALKVRNPLGIVQHLFDIRSFILENKTWI